MFLESQIPPDIPQNQSPLSNPTIRTPRLLLRAPTPDEIEVVHFIRTHPDVAKWQ
jgi:hypothetical protein